MTIKDQIVEFLVKYGFQMLGAAVILACGFFVANLLGKLVQKTLHRFKLEPPVELLFVRLAKLLVLAITLVLVVSKIGVDIAPLVAGMGVIGVGIGLATQGVLANLVAGLLIIFTKPFRIGQYIEMLGEEGLVHEIDLFTTKLMHADRSIVVIPNRKISGEILHNYGTIRQLSLEVGVGYNSDLAKVEQTVRALLSRNSRVLKDPAPVYAVTSFGDSSINLAVRPWVAASDFGPARSELLLSIIDSFRAAGIEIPFPQREIRVLPDESKHILLEAEPPRVTAG